MGHGSLKQALLRELCLPILSSEPVSIMKQKDDSPHVFPAETTVNTFKNFWRKWWFITYFNNLCSIMYLQLQLSKNIFLVQSVSHLTSLVLHKLKEKSFILGNIITAIR